MVILKGQGPKECQLALVGEALGENEELFKRPFAGSSGDILNTKLHRVGVARQACYITNVVKVRPGRLPKLKVWDGELAAIPQEARTFRKKGKNLNDIDVLWSGKRPHPQLLWWRDQLLAELDSVKTNLVVALGGTALWALTGHSQIGKWRGSILETTLPSGRKVKVVGTYHPSAANRDWSLGAIMEYDLRRAVEESATPTFTSPERHYHTRPSEADIRAFFKRGTADEFAYDIETSPRNIECISFAFDDKEAMSIPTTVEYWGTEEQLHRILCLIDELMQTDKLKIAHNVSFDVQYMVRYWGILPKGPWFDTMIAQHACYSELPKSLAFCTSIYTREPYYKDDLKTWMEDVVSHEELGWEYNAKDSAVTVEVKHALQENLTSMGTQEVFDHMMELVEPLIFCMLRGLDIDTKELARLRLIALADLSRLETEFQKNFPDWNPHSDAQIKKLAYDVLKLPKKYKKGKLTVDGDALAKLAKLNPHIAKVADIRTKRKLASTYLDATLETIDNKSRFIRPAKRLTDGTDGRLRFSLNSTGTKTGRISSNESVFNCGNNLQNWPKSLRTMVVPKPGNVLTQADLKGAEAMIVAYLTKDEQLIELFKAGGNVHEFTATKILWPDFPVEKLKTDKLNGMYRYDIAKRVRHGANYRMSWVKLSDILNCPAAQAKEYIAKYEAANPMLKRWYKEVDTQVKMSRTLVTPLGRKRVFFGRIESGLFREATAFIPQETCAHILNIGLLRVYNELCHRADVDILLQVHDSILVEHPVELTEFVHEELLRLMRVDMIIKGREFFIPVELEVGSSWGKMEVV